MEYNWTKNKLLITEFKNVQGYVGATKHNSNLKSEIQPGPRRAKPTASNDPTSWPNVAPAPMNPNSLAPACQSHHYIESYQSIIIRKLSPEIISAECTWKEPATYETTHVQVHRNPTSLVMTSVMRAHIAEMVNKFNNAICNKKVSDPRLKSNNIHETKSGYKPQQKVTR